MTTPGAGTTVFDAPGRQPKRIVSLVPSLTETVVWLGLLDRLVGRTRYCVEPAGTIEVVETVGGTKNPDISRICELRPDLVIVNKEENRREDAEALVEAGIAVHVTHPRTVVAAADMIEELGQVLAAPRRARSLVSRIRRELEKAALATAVRRRPRAFCPIWRNPWMTFHDRTYVGDMLVSAGFENVFGNGAATDFFEVTLGQVVAHEPDVIVLPDEPYVFARKHGEELRTHGLKGEIYYVDGRDLSWYGPRVPSALARLLTITREISRA